MFVLIFIVGIKIERSLELCYAREVNIDEYDLGNDVRLLGKHGTYQK